MANRECGLAGVPCWADLWTTDVDGSRRFYCELFGWTALAPSEEFGGYWMFDRCDAPVAGGMGSMGDIAANNAWKPYFCTLDMNASLEKAEAGGATIQMAAMPVADLGVQAVLADPAGAVFGLWQPGTFEGFRVVGEDASPSWFELHTSAHAQAVAFYRELFGYELDGAPDTDEFRYSTFRAVGTDDALGGITDSSRRRSAGGDRWVIYWHVDDALATADRAERLGGSVTLGPDRTPYGTLVCCTDPAGAEFRLWAST